MTLTFTTTTEHEHNEIIAIDPIAARDSSRRDFLLSSIRYGHCISVRKAERLVAFAITSPSFFHQPMVELLVVCENHRRSGIALKALLNLVERYAKPILWTSTNQSNMPMRKLLEKAGFIHAGSIEGLDEGDPEMIFRITQVQN